jgi:hypothetical protein
MTATSLPPEKLFKGQILYCLADKKSFKVADINELSIKLVCIEETLIRFMPLSSLKADEWVVEEKHP